MHLCPLVVVDMRSFNGLLTGALHGVSQVCFERFDRDRSGRIDHNELRDGLLSMGYAISPPLLNILISKYDRTGQAKAMDYDNFVE